MPRKRRSVHTRGYFCGWNGVFLRFVHTRGLICGRSLEDIGFSRKNRQIAVTRTHYDIYTGSRGWGEYPYFDGSGGKPYTSPFQFSGRIFKAEIDVER